MYSSGIPLTIFKSLDLQYFMSCRAPPWFEKPVQACGAVSYDDETLPYLCGGLSTTDESLLHPCDSVSTNGETLPQPYTWFSSKKIINHPFMQTSKPTNYDKFN